MKKKKLSAEKQKFLFELLMKAINNNDVDTIKATIDLGVDVNAANENGLTPLLAACAIGNVESTKLLFKHENTDVSALPMKTDLNINL